MRHRLTSIVRGAGVSWLAPLAILALPNCIYHGRELDDPPLNNAIFCDIEDRDVPRRCATSGDLMMGISLSQAAVALISNQSPNIGLDYSPEAIALQGCAPGQPVAITFKGPFPKGSHLCLDCDRQLGPGLDYADPPAACVALCRTLHDPENPTEPGLVAFCQDHAHTATNASGCFDGACTDPGELRMDWDSLDPRRIPEPVAWLDHLGTDVGPESNTLVRTAETTEPVSAFDAGAASSQVVTRGDAYVEFTAVQTTFTRMLGFAVGAPPDTVPTAADINFAISLSSSAEVFVVQSGSPNGPLGTYQSGDRFRVVITDRHDGNADITYFQIPAACPPMTCSGMPLGPAAGPAPYPFRVDASLREKDAELNDVRVVRIK